MTGISTSAQPAAKATAAEHGSYKVGGKAKAAQLIMPYTKTKRAWDVACVWVFAGVLAYYSSDLKDDSWVVLGLLGGMLLADFFSGVLHWGFDTWGTQDTPLAGPFIRSFREHHVDPVAMCNHDFFEANGDSCAVMIGLLVVIHVFHDLTGVSLLWYHHMPSLWLSFSLYGALTNELHKWAHARTKNAVVLALQRWHLILPPQHHNGHHQGEHDTKYCITTGWCNGPLDAIDFWRVTERAISSWTGAEARHDDAKLLSLVR